MPRAAHAVSSFVPRVLGSLCLALAALAGAAHAQAIDPAVEISVGYYEPSFETRVRLDSPAFGIGDALDLERDLLVEDEAQELRAELAFRLGQRNRIVFDHVAFDRSGANTRSETIQFGDVVYAANAELAARVASEHTSFAWRFSFVRGEVADIAVSLGASWIDVEARLEGTAIATANGIPVGSGAIAERGEASGPVPLAGLHGRWWLGQRFRVAADARYFDIDDFEGWSGSLVDLGARLDWFFTPNFAVGLGYASTEIEADFEDTDSLGAIDYAFDGLRASVTVAF